MRLIKVSIAVWLLSLLCTSGASAQQPDYSGTWVLNLEKSKLQGMSTDFTGSKFIIRQQGQDFRLKRYHYYGERKNKLKFKMKADGKTRTIKLLFKGKLEWEGETLKSTLTRKNFLNIVDYYFGKDSNEFIAEETFKGLPKDHHNIWVFDRAVPGS